ncbi:hypothetical protein D2Q93_07970 [Alicyclobacillaceae bacterium I2511]|jgi:hypothetical protein|nr:hypothetical protein D2Q93_07970 [Alicyclobacillaceae bacterium I2511]
MAATVASAQRYKFIEFFFADNPLVHETAYGSNSSVGYFIQGCSNRGVQPLSEISFQSLEELNAFVKDWHEQNPHIHSTHLS